MSETMNGDFINMAIYRIEALFFIRPWGVHLVSDGGRHGLEAPQFLPLDQQGK
jgi:hypothetical protein